MRGNRDLRWACVCAVLLLFVGPATGAAWAAERPFQAPVDADVVRRFEPPSHRFGPGHRGIDYGVAPGTVVRAAGDGTVSFAGPVAADGQFITIEHAGGIATTYSYLSRADAAKGDRVAKGQAVGASGEGHPGGPPVLHFGAKRNGEYIDPELLLREFDDITDLLELVPIGQAVAGSRAFQAAPSVAGSSVQFEVPSASRPELTEVNRSEPSRAQLEMAAPNANAVWIPPKFRLSPTEIPESSSDSPPIRRADRTDAEWWRELPPDIKRTLVESDPERWARKFGVSSRDRDAINRMLLDQKIEELERHRNSPDGRAELRRQELWNWTRGVLFGPLAVRSKFDREAAIDRKLRSARALKRQLAEVTENRDNHLSKSDVYLLDFDIDFANGDGKAVVALGDPVTADHIGVLVPGINNAVGTIAGAMDDAAILRSQVHRTLNEDLASRTSTIVWMGYDNPNGLHDAPNRAEAHEGAPWLNSFVSDLRSGHEDSPQSPHITVFGHSYGSVVTGLAALDGMKADDVVFYGSPGMGKWRTKASDLPQERVWAAESRQDPINWVNGLLGTNPAAKWFGAREVALGPDNRGHSDYIIRDSKATIEFAKILTGRFNKK